MSHIVLYLSISGVHPSQCYSLGGSNVSTAQGLSITQRTQIAQRAETLKSEKLQPTVKPLQLIATLGYFLHDPIRGFEGSIAQRFFLRSIYRAYKKRGEIKLKNKQRRNIFVNSE